MSSTGALLIVDTNAESGGLETLPPTDDLEIVDRATFAAGERALPPEVRVCINSEAAMDDVLDRLDSTRAAAIRTLKDKTAFRKMLSSLYPDFQFSEVAMDQLAAVQLEPARRYVIKPSLGCFGTGVRLVDGDADLAAVQAEIADEVRRNGEVLSSDVLSADTLIIEQYIPGEEYAIDMYYDGNGTPRITNLYHHPMPRNPAYLHMVYYSSRDVVGRVHDKGMAFLRAMNEHLGLVNVPLHCEVRLDGEHLVPIEINAMRFGGMGLANLSWYSHGSNAYRHFIDGTAPDWESILAEDDAASVFFIAYNGTDVDVDAVQPDWSALESRFTTVLRREAFDHRSQLAFGVLFAKEPIDAIADLLDIEFNDYFVTVSP